MKHTLVGTIILAVASQLAGASIIFDDFNVDEGHFASSIGYSGSNRGLDDSSSAADPVTTGGPLEGAGYQRLNLVYNTADMTGLFRVRNLSGVGRPENNVSFQTSDGEDGWIGFYLRTTDAVGWTASMWLDRDNTIPTMEGGTGMSIIADGQWHLYEWNLDDFGDWAGFWGIGVPPVDNGTHTLDSICFWADPSSPFANVTIDLDFVAKSDSGSIAALVPAVPEPSTYLAGVLLLLPFGVSAFRKLRRQHAA